MDCPSAKAEDGKMPIPAHCLQKQSDQELGWNSGLKELFRRRRSCRGEGGAAGCEAAGPGNRRRIRWNTMRILGDRDRRRWWPGRGAPAPGAGAARSQEDGGRGCPTGIRKSPMARKVHASFTKFQAMLSPWDHVAEGAYHQFVAM